MKPQELKMKRLSQLLNFASIYLLIVLFGTILNQLLLINKFEKLQTKKVPFGTVMNDNVDFQSYFICSIMACVLLIYLAYHLNIFRQVTNDFKKEMIFSPSNGKQLIKVGQGVLLFSIFAGLFKWIIEAYVHYNNIVNDSLSLAYNTGRAFGFGMAVSLKFIAPFILISLFVLLIGRLIEKGAIIKSENDLTI